MRDRGAKIARLFDGQGKREIKERRARPFEAQDKLKPAAEKVENYTAMEWNPGRAMEKIPTSQAVKINSGFLPSFGMTPEGIFPQTVKPAPTWFGWAGFFC
jgi:hypothetical protein